MKAVVEAGQRLLMLFWCRLVILISPDAPCFLFYKVHLHSAAHAAMAALFMADEKREDSKSKK